MTERHCQGHWWKKANLGCPLNKNNSPSICPNIYPKGITSRYKAEKLQHWWIMFNPLWCRISWRCIICGDILIYRSVSVHRHILYLTVYLLLTRSLTTHTHGRNPIHGFVLGLKTNMLRLILLSTALQTSQLIFKTIHILPGSELGSRGTRVRNYVRV